jgi:hypothetical protein
VLNGTLFERVLAWSVEQQGSASTFEARRTFEAATGPIVEGARDYEQRITHFWEQQLCGGEAQFARFAAAHSELPEAERRELAGWLRSHRSLFEFEGVRDDCGILQDRVLGSVYSVSIGDHDRKLGVGDRFDARLIPIGDQLFLSPGRVFHPVEAHAALDALLARIDFAALPHEQLLDALLLMRSRYLQFESVRPEHVYQERALSPVRLQMRESRD